jgi:hypothetical protein
VSRSRGNAIEVPGWTPFPRERPPSDYGCPRGS